MRRLLGLCAGVALCALAVALLVQPPPVQRAEHWAWHTLTGYMPPPIVAGRNGRLFLGNHEGSAPGSLIRDTCGDGIGPETVAHARAAIAPVLAAGHTLPVPFRFLLVPTAPRIYPEDVPARMPCDDWTADRVVRAAGDGALLYPVTFMQALKARFDVLPKRHFHWAGEGPLRVAEWTAGQLGLVQAATLALRPDNRSSDLNGFYPGMGLHDRIGTPDLRRAGVSQCWGTLCHPAVPDSVVAFTRTGPGRLLILADSFGDEFGGDFTEFAGTVWMVRMNLAVAEAPGIVATAMHAFAPDAVLVVYHDAGAMAFDAASQASLATTAKLLLDAHLPPAGSGP